ncbi:hypothetical protein PJ900_19640 [Tistrella mobilis]|jgi:chromosome segregation ATPase|nr:hypothetical protein [Tistrella mobilis]
MAWQRLSSALTRLDAASRKAAERVTQARAAGEAAASGAADVRLDALRSEIESLAAERDRLKAALTTAEEARLRADDRGRRAGEQIDRAMDAIGRALDDR